MGRGRRVGEGERWAVLAVGGWRVGRDWNCLLLLKEPTVNSSKNISMSERKTHHQFRALQADSAV